MNEESIVRPIFAPTRVQALIPALLKLDDSYLFMVETLIKGLSSPGGTTKSAPRPGAYPSWATDSSIVHGLDEPKKAPSLMLTIARRQMRIYKPKRLTSPKTIEELQKAGYTVISYESYMKGDEVDLINSLLRKDRRFYRYHWNNHDRAQEGEESNPIDPLKVFNAHSWYLQARKKERLLTIDEAFPNYRVYRWNQEGKLVSPDIEALPPEAGDLC